ncbi:serine/threonine-protein kinase NIM1 [Clonorchis sinensis]|uniref:non-specific serine/threonine protein kinase n=1 Tax=Clonorchis sinensis TaxID=79923 RepID=G7YRH3_CLOSI|nr:serine/threonine-protein kinase NIM1 [Clonorchis sinensis]
MSRASRETAPPRNTENDWFNASIMQSILVPQEYPVGESLSNESLSAQVGKQFSRIAENALQPAARKSSQKLISSSHRFSSVGGIPHSHHVKKSNTQPPQKQDSVSMRPTNSPTFDSNCPFEESRIHPSPSMQVNFELGSSNNKQASGQSKRRSTSSFRTSSTSSKPSGMLSRQHTDSSGSGRFAYLDSPGILKAAPSCPGFLDPVQPSKFQPTVTRKTAEGQPMPLTKSSECKTESSGNAPASRLRVNTTTVGLDFYRIQETIGTGNFSQVKLATHILTKELVAIKVLDKTRMNTSTQKLLMREISILECLHHPNIIRLYEVVETLTRLHLVMEYVAGGDLNKRIARYGKFSEPEAKIIFAQLVSAVNHLHEKNIFHRDIKADNILFTSRAPGAAMNPHTAAAYPLEGHHVARARKVRPPIRRWLRVRSRDVHINQRSLSESSRASGQAGSYGTSSGLTERERRDVREKSSPWSNKSRATEEGTIHGISLTDRALSPEDYRVKLADFGFSRLAMSSDQALTTFCGSPAYAAPELFEAQNYQGGPVDVWALGIVLFFLLTGLLPYRGSTVGQVRRLVLENRGSQPPAWLSPAATALYSRLTARLPSERPTVSQLIEFAGQTGPSSKDAGLGGGDQFDATTMMEAKEMLWAKWLYGQSFPKALPRFNRCAPLLSSMKENASKRVDAASHTGITVVKDRGSSPSVQQPSQSYSSIKSVNPSLFSLNTQESEVSSSSNNNNNRSRESIIEKKKASLLVTPSKRPSSEEIELEAARLLMKLGVTREEVAAAKNMEARSAVTGAYRIILHRLHKARRFSNLDAHEKNPSSEGTSLHVTSLAVSSADGTMSTKSAKSPHTIRARPAKRISRRTSRLCELL